MMMMMITHFHEELLKTEQSKRELQTDWGYFIPGGKSILASIPAVTLLAGRLRLLQSACSSYKSWVKTDLRTSRTSTSVYSRSSSQSGKTTQKSLNLYIHLRIFEESEFSRVLWKTRLFVNCSQTVWRRRRWIFNCSSSVSSSQSRLISI